MGSFEGTCQFLEKRNIERGKVGRTSGILKRWYLFFQLECSLQKLSVYRYFVLKQKKKESRDSTNLLFFSEWFKKKKICQNFKYKA